MTTRIAITDDHEMILKGISSILEGTKEIEIVGLFHDGQETLEKIDKSNPDILLLDINLPDINGVELCKKLTKKYPNLKIIALTSFDELSYVKRILSNGAHGYLLKNTDKKELIKAFKTVLNGEIFLQREIERRLLNHSMGKKEEASGLVKLTIREQEVLEAISEELTTQQISEKLFISPKTVETHRMNIMSKLQAKNSVGMVKNAMNHGLL